jgi:ribonuclease H / adenosylcobalamin/alpha-ribazole phosphatase
VSERFLVRHAPTGWTGQRYCGRSDPPLDAAGRAAALTLANEVAAMIPPGARLVASPRRRAVETAEAIRAAGGLGAIEIDDRWREADFGRAEGLTFDALAVIEPDLAARLVSGETDIDWPGGETAGSLVARVRSALADLEGDVVVVSHAGPLRIAIAEIRGVRPQDVDMPGAGTVVRLPVPDRAAAATRATLPR